MLFEYDPAKSARNRAKHGIDFEQAKRLWDDPRFVEVDVAYEDEARYAVIGMIGGKHWTAIITYRGLVVRIISVRRSRKKEVAISDDEHQSGGSRPHL